MLRPLLASVLSAAAALVLLPAAAHAQCPPPGQYAPPGPCAPPGQYAPSGQYAPPGRAAPPGQYGPPGQYAPPGQYGPPGQYAPPGQYNYPPPQYAPPPRYPPPQYPPPQYNQYPQQPPPPAPSSPPWGQLGITAHAGFVHGFSRSDDGIGFGLGARTWAFHFPLDIGVEFESDRYKSERNDYRANADLYATLWKSSWFNPYLVVPLGLNVVTTPNTSTSFQGSVGAGVGLMISIWRIAASAEGRLYYRRGQDTSPWATETVAEARLNLMILTFDL